MEVMRHAPERAPTRDPDWRESAHRDGDPAVTDRDVVGRIEPPDTHGGAAISCLHEHDERRANWREPWAGVPHVMLSRGFATTIGRGTRAVKQGEQ